MQIAWEMIHCLWIFIKIEQMKVLRVWKGEKDVISKRKDVDKEKISQSCQRLPWLS